MALLSLAYGIFRRRPQTVASIVGVLLRIMRRLQAHAEKQDQMVVAIDHRIEQIETLRTDRLQESTKARRIHENLQKILEG